MLYKKYVIEIITKIFVITDSKITSSNLYGDQINIRLDPVSMPLNSTQFLDVNGLMSNTPHIYHTYDEALNILNTHYYNITNKPDVLLVRVSSYYDDNIPPIGVLRSLKLDKILKNRKTIL